MKLPAMPVHDLESATLNFEQLQALPTITTGNTGKITLGAFTSGTWTSVVIAHGLRVIPKGFGGHLIGTGSPSIVTGIPVTPESADATNINLGLDNISAFNLTSGTVNINWWVIH